MNPSDRYMNPKVSLSVYNKTKDVNDSVIVCESLAARKPAANEPFPYAHIDITFSLMFAVETVRSPTTVLIVFTDIL